jgi:U3 small nucleolar RNA-associated protein 14
MVKTAKYTEEERKVLQKERMSNWYKNNKQKWCGKMKRYYYEDKLGKEKVEEIIRKYNGDLGTALIEMKVLVQIKKAPDSETYDIILEKNIPQ